MFPGCCSLEAAQDICEDEQALTHLQHLHRHSLVVTGEYPTGVRFQMLETVREYALGKLADEDKQRLRQRHAGWFLAFAERAEANLHGAAQAAWLERLEQDHHNVLGALSWFKSQGQTAGGLRLAGRMWKFWWLRGHLHCGGQWLAEMLRVAQDDNESDVGTALLGAAHIARGRGDHTEALRLTEESLRRFERTGDEQARCRAVRFLASNPNLVREDPVRCLNLQQEAIAVCRGAGDEAGVAEGLQYLSMSSWASRDLHLADRMLTEAIALYRRLEDAHGLARALGDAGYIAMCSGNYGDASAHFDEMLQLARQGEVTDILCRALCHLGNLACCQGNYGQAIELLEQSLVLRRQQDNREGVADALASLSVAVACEGELEKARLLQERSLQARRALGARVDSAFSIDHLGWIFLHQNNIAQARAMYEESLAMFRAARHYAGISSSLHGLGHVLLRRGHAASAHPLLHESLRLRRACGEKRGMIESLEAMAHVMVAQRRFERAVCLFGAASTQRLLLSMPLCTADRAAHQRVLTILLTALGEPDFARRWAEGEDLDLTCAVQLGLE